MLAEKEKYEVFSNGRRCRIAMRAFTMPRIAIVLLVLVLMVMVVRCDDIENAMVMAIVQEEDEAEVKGEPEVMEEQREEGRKNETTMQKLEEPSPESRRNVTLVNQTESGFMPSFHLGPIGTFPGPSYDLHRQANKTPFNGEQFVSNGGDRPNSPYDGTRSIKFDTGQNDRNQDQKHSKLFFRPSDRDGNYVKFVDDKGDDTHEEGGTKCHKDTNNRQGEPSSAEPVIVHQPDYSEQQQVVGYAGENYGSGQQYVTTYQTKPSKFHDTTGYSAPYQHAVLASDNNYYSQYHGGGQYEGYHDENAIKPETVINVHPISYQATNIDTLTKPKTVVYVTTHETTRTRKFPYQYFQPQVYEHTETPEHNEPYPMFYDHQQNSVSPWKKILHLIGAFLPIGLLIALLSPKVISANSATGAGSGDPNIVLSKLRVNDLPAEHKRTRLALDTGACEEHSICRLLVAAGDNGGGILGSLLLHAAERAPESAVRKKELDRIFEAAKLGNCDILTCNFYDGT